MEKAGQTVDAVATNDVVDGKAIKKADAVIKEGKESNEKNINDEVRDMPNEEPVAAEGEATPAKETKEKGPPTKKAKRTPKVQREDRNRRSSSRLQNLASGQTLPGEISSDNLPKGAR